MPARKISLKVIQSPATGHVVDAPPVLMASDHSADFVCGQCGAVLMHAEEHQVFNVLFQCRNCGSYNRTET